MIRTHKEILQDARSRAHEGDVVSALVAEVAILEFQHAKLLARVAALELELPKPARLTQPSVPSTSAQMLPALGTLPEPGR